MSSRTTSRRPSQVVHGLASTASPTQASMAAHHDQVGLPVRHPRSLTVAELHLELEKEQEAVVNRLTRELSALRAQHSASTVSNASSTTSTTPSLIPIDPADPSHNLTGPTHPLPARRHRSSSSISGRGIPTPASTTSSQQATTGSHAQTPQGQSQASVDRAAAATGRISRNPSVSGRSTPARQSVDFHHIGGLALPSRPGLSGREGSHTSQTGSSTHATLGSTNSHASLAHAHGSAAPGGSGVLYGVGQGVVEVERSRSELEAVKLENDALRERIKALERMLRSRRESSESELSVNSTPQPSNPRHSATTTGQMQAPPPTGGSGISVSAWAASSTGASVAGPRERSESQSTEASVRRRLEGQQGVLGPVGAAVGASQEERDDAVKVGESAGSSSVLR